ncbi:MAG: protein kinase [Planctomycetales bacterium]|nr:protein kinase [Planctomycetales bacterium]
MSPAEPDDFNSEDKLDQLLGRVADEIERRLRAGEKVTAVEYCADYPGLANELPEVIDSLRALTSPEFLDSTNRACSWRFDTIQLGDYRLLREIGRGGMGIVYEALQISSTEKVAVKVFPFVSVFEPKKLRRFRNEAIAAATLDHPHIVPVFDIAIDGDRHYYVMKLIEGPSLNLLVGDKHVSARSYPKVTTEVDHRPSCLSADARLRDDEDSQNTLPLEPSGTRVLPVLGMRNRGEFERQIAVWIRDVALAIQYAHDAGIVHRDVKPSNLLVDETGHVWVTDFGLATMRAGDALTQTGDFVGTLPYLSPDVLRDPTNSATPRSDVYALGVTLFELVVGVKPFSATGRDTLMKQIIRGDVTCTGRILRETSRDLRRIAAAAMAQDPEVRYATATELADDLSRFLRGEPVLARQPSITSRCWKWLRRNHTIAITASAVLLCLTVLATYLWVLNKQLLESNELYRATVLATSLQNAHWAYLDGDLSQADAILQQIRPTGPVRADSAYAWQLLHDAIRSRSFKSHVSDQPLYCIIAHPDREHYIAAGAASELFLLDMKTLEVVDSWPTSQVEVNCISLSGDGTRLATSGDDGTVCVWDLASHDELLRFRAHDTVVYLAQFADRDRMLVTHGTERVIRIWNSVDGSAIGRVECHSESVTALDVSDDGRYFCSAGKNGDVWLTDTRNLASSSYLARVDGRIDDLVFRGLDEPVLTVFNDVICYLMTSTDGSNKELDPTASNVSHTSFFGFDRYCSVDYCAEQRTIVAGNRSGLITQLTLPKTSVHFSSPDQREIIWCEGSSNGARTVAAASDSVAWIEHTERKTVQRVVFDAETMSSGGRSTERFGFRHDGKQLVVGNTLFSPNELTGNWQVVHRFNVEKLVESANFSPHGNSLFLRTESEVVLADTSDYTTRNIALPDGVRVTTCCWSQNGWEIWLGCIGGELLRIDTRQDAIEVLGVMPDPIEDIAACQSVVALAFTTGTVGLYDTHLACIRKRFRPPGKLLPITQVGMTTHGRVILASSNGILYGWDAGNEELLFSRTCRSDVPFRYHDGRIVVVDEADVVHRISDLPLDHPKKINRRKSHNGRVFDVMLTDVGACVSVGADGTVSSEFREDNGEYRWFRDEEDDCDDACLLGDSRRVLVTSRDNELSIVDLATGKRSKLRSTNVNDNDKWIVACYDAKRDLIYAQNTSSALCVFDARTLVHQDRIALDELGPITSMRISPGGAILFADRSSSLLQPPRCWDLAKRAPAFSGLRDTTMRCCFSSCGRYAAINQDGDNATIVWDIDSRRQLAKRRGDASAICFTHDGHGLYIGSSGRAIELWDWKITDSITATFLGNTSPIQHIQEVRGSLFAVGINGDTLLWDLRTGSPLFPLNLLLPDCRLCELSTDGKVIVSLTMRHELNVARAMPFGGERHVPLAVNIDNTEHEDGTSK